MPADVATEAVRREYDRLAEVYDGRWSSYLDESVRFALAGSAAEGIGDRVLDAPCGTGELVRRLRRTAPGARIVGVDLSAAMLARARGKLKEEAAWLHADLRELPLAAATFDTVYCASALHCFESAVGPLSEFRRVLRPGGRLVLVDWCGDDLLARFRTVGRRFVDPAFARLYRASDCRGFLEDAGFRIDQQSRRRIAGGWRLMRFVASARDRPPELVRTPRSHPKSASSTAR